MKLFLLGLVTGLAGMGLTLGFYTTNTEVFAMETTVAVLPTPPPGIVSGAPVRMESCGNFDFRFLVTSEWQMSSNIMNIDVFLDPSAFNEQNLSEIFSYLSKKHPDAKILTIDVETDWMRVQIANVCPSGDSERPLDPARNDFYMATFRRGEKRAQFRYNPRLKTDERKTVKMEPGTF